MKKWMLTLLFAAIFISYYLLATRGTGKFLYDLDYFNPLAKSFLDGRLDISNPVVTYDLSNFGGKWYPYWGPIPALFLIPFQLFLGRYIPAGYLSVFFGSLSVTIVWLVLDRLSREYFHDKLTLQFKLLLLIFFAFGTSMVFVSLRSGVWYVSQTVATVPALLAFWILIKKKLTGNDYFWSSFLISSNLLGRISLILLGAFLIFRLFADRPAVLTKILLSLAGFVIFLIPFLIYNALRFSSPLDTGYLYQDLTHFDIRTVLPYGELSFKYIPKNLWLIFMEIPKITLSAGKILIDYNHEGTSIFFVSPIFLAALLTLKKNMNRLLTYLWATLLILLAPTLFIFSPGYYQFGIRYSLDFSMILLTLVVFGLKGKINSLVLLGTIMAVVLNIYSTFIL